MALPEVWTYGSQDDHRTSKHRLGRLAAKQAGLVTWAQLRALRIAASTVHSWVDTGYLFIVRPRVYAVGHRPTDARAEMFGLVLFAGPDAELSHGTSAHWRGWLRYAVASTHISTPRRIRAKMPGVVFHGRRELERELVNGLPCTTVTQTLLDLAATESRRLVHRALAQLDYDRRLDNRAVSDACDGRPGSAALREALRSHIPQLARTKSELEDEFLYLCQRFEIPLPEVNVQIHGIEVDCYWPQFGFVVELDGGGNHGTAAQRNTDQRRSLKLRAHGVPVIRYTWDQITRDARTVAADLLAQMLGPLRSR